MALLWLLVGPRVELPGLHGLRVEDLVLALLGAACLIEVRQLRLPLPLTAAMGAVVVAGLISTAVAAVRGMVDPGTAALFAIRPLEYWIAFPAVVLLLRAAPAWTGRLEVLLGVVTVLQTAFAVMQYYFGLQVGFSHAAYSRAAGLTVGPYELGAMSAALLVFWASRGRLGLASLASIALTASISRISILGGALALLPLLAVWLVHLVRAIRVEGPSTAVRARLQRPWRTVGGTVSVAAACVVLAYTLGLLSGPGNGSTATTATAAAPATTSAPPAVEIPGTDSPSAVATSEPKAQDPDETAPSATPSAAPPTEQPQVAVPTIPDAPSDSITQRLESTSILGSWNVSGRLAQKAPSVHDTDQYLDVAYTRLHEFVDTDTAAAAGAEASNLVRFFRWHLILRTIDDPVDVALGLGPSFTGPSVDGSYLRMLADGGVLGVASWIALIVLWLRRSPLWMVCVTVSLLVGALFIDIVYAERPMVLFWALLALAVFEGGRGRAAEAARLGRVRRSRTTDTSPA